MSFGLFQENPKKKLDKKSSQGPPSNKPGQATPTATENGTQGDAPTFEVAGSAIVKYHWFGN